MYKELVIEDNFYSILFYFLKLFKVDSLLVSFLKDIGCSHEQFVKTCDRSRLSKHPIYLVCSFNKRFKKSFFMIFNLF
jgi:hypothetical protein